MDSKQKVEFSYVAFYGFAFLVTFALAWFTAGSHPKAYRRLMPPLGALTAIIIFSGIIVAQHYYPGG